MRFTGRGRVCGRLMLIVAIMASLFVLPTLAEAAQPELVQIIHIDNYDKTVAAGENATYNWTLRNVNSGANLTVLFTASITGKGWTYAIEPESMILGPGDLGSLRLTTFAPLEKGDLVANFSVTLLVYEQGYLVQVTTVHATTTIVGVLAVADKVLGLFDNPLPAPLDNEWGVFLLSLIIWLAIAAGIAFLIDAIGTLLSRKTATMLEKIITGILRTPLLILIFLYGVVQSLDALHRHIPEGVRSTILSIYHLLIVIIIFYLAYKMFKNVLVYYGKIIAKRTASRVDDILVPIIEKVGIVVIAAAALIYALAALNVDLTMFVLGGTLVSLVIAFAAQETLSNFFSGIFILLDRPFKEGDIVILQDGDWCEVRKIGLRTTKLFRYMDATIVAIPNNKLVNDKIANFSSVPDKGRVMMTFDVSYDSDVEKVRSVIREVVTSCEWLVNDDPSLTPIVRFDAMADSSLKFFVLAWLYDRADRFNVKDYLNTHIFRRFSEEGIEVPFPQRTVHLREPKRRSS